MEMVEEQAICASGVTHVRHTCVQRARHETSEAALIHLVGVEVGRQEGSRGM